MTRDDNADLVRLDRSAACFDAGSATTGPVDACHFALLDDVDPKLVRGTCEAPGNSIVTGNARAALQRRTDDRISGVRRRVDIRNRFLDLRGVDNFCIDAIEPVCINAPLNVAHVL